MLPQFSFKEIGVLKVLGFEDPVKECFWLCNNRHPCFSSRAKLKAFKSLNPIPPFALGLHNLSHVIHGIFLSSFFCPHQNRLIMAPSSLHNESGSLKQLMEYVGMAWATAFISVSLPALDSNFPFQPTILFPTWSLILLKAFFFPLPTNEGSLRYCSCCPMIYAPNRSLMESWISVDMFLLKNREVLSLFIFCPDAIS